MKSASLLNSRRLKNMSTSERMNSPPSLWRPLKLPWLLVDVACWSNCWGQRKLINQILNDQHYNCNSFSCWISEQCSIHCCHYTGNVSTKISCKNGAFFFFFWYPHLSVSFTLVNSRVSSRKKFSHLHLRFVIWPKETDVCGWNPSLL